ncbi:DUF6188 family protein [Saccharothrix sp. ST-888]|uniref:DUF6188 family protein n=1 Tax=Saccharothrix sp. ST-888 TaxID=1427391 RepID=UPI0005ECE393|nr:DUF6188 family protein [Saccharothrix sp. ST-888]KJK57382.1 hypothetical protein UK12_16785 [Saccharothrix sp. ST-888]
MVSPSIAAVLGGRRVEALKGGSGLVLELSDGVVVTVSGDFRLIGQSAVEHFYPALGLTPSRDLLGLVGSRVTRAETTPAGGLDLAFTSGSTLSVPPDGAYQPWSASDQDGPLFTAAPYDYLTG